LPPAGAQLREREEQALPRGSQAVLQVLVLPHAARRWRRPVAASRPAASVAEAYREPELQAQQQELALLPLPPARGRSVPGGQELIPGPEVERSVRWAQGLLPAMGPGQVEEPRSVVLPEEQPEPALGAEPSAAERSAQGCAEPQAPGAVPQEAVPWVELLAWRACGSRASRHHPCRAFLAYRPGPAGPGRSRSPRRADSRRSPPRRWPWR
jgi:hypothetical protein